MKKNKKALNIGNKSMSSFYNSNNLKDPLIFKDLKVIKGKINNFSNKFRPESSRPESTR